MLGLRIGIADTHIQQKAIQLRFGQRIGAFLLDGVLRGHHQEQFGQRITGATHRHLALGHGLQEGGLYFGGRPVDLVGQQEVMKDGALLELKRGFLRPIDLGTGQVRRQQIWRELDAMKIALQSRG